MPAADRGRIVGALVVLLSSFPLVAAEPDEAGKSVGPLTLLIDRRTGNQLAAAADYIAAEDWKTAVRLLQHVLDGKEDVMVQRKAGVLILARAEARRMLAGMPPAGRELYEKTYGPAAADLLKQGRKFRDRERLARVVHRYLFTAAGPDALQDLAREDFRAGDWLSAASHFEKLLKHRGVARWTTEDLYQAAVAARRANREIDDEALTRELLNRAGAEGVRIGERTLGREQLKKELERAPVAAQPAGEWPVYRGNAARLNQGDGGPAFLEPRWKQGMIYHDSAGPAAQMLQKAEQGLKRVRQPLLPSYFPITATITRGDKPLPLLIFKNYWGIQAVNVKTGKLEWNSPGNWSLERMLARTNDARKVQALTNWLTFYVDQNQRPGIVFENSTVGTLSTDNQFLYVVEDFAVPPPPQTFMPTGDVKLTLDLNESIHHSRLQAYSLATNGKLVWEVGCFGEEDNPLSDSFFLGPPLPLRGLIYVLIQKQKELRLACLDPKANGKVVFTLPLAQTAGALSEDVMRRTQAVHLTYADGMLVVPTNAGAVFGIDLRENSLAWAYPYREKEDQPPEPHANVGFRGRIPPGWMMTPDGRLVPNAPPPHQWKVSAPAIQDGKVVFTAPDARSLQCLNLRDGTLVWKKPRQEDDLYFGGVYRGKVVVVGKKRARGLSLANGETLWDLETGVPSGQGIASANVYYLPLAESAQTREPEVCAIDVDKGAIVAHTRSRTKEVPGNLLFYQDNVVSQSAQEVVAYPQLKLKIAQMDELIARNPKDPAGLTERGTLRLDQGDLPGAIDDLRAALRNDPPAEVRGRARAKLYDAMTDFLQRDFQAGEKFLKEYEALAQVDAGPDATNEERAAAQKEESKRRTQFLYLVARGRESQGKLLDALKAYLDLAAQGSDELVPSLDDPAVKVRPDVWARGRIDQLLKKADAEQRKRLEEEIERRRKKAEGEKEPAALREFVALFGAESAAGRAARLTLAGRLIEDSEKSDREAELLLEGVRHRHEDPARAAQATEMLARLNTRRGLIEDALAYYRILARDFAKVALPDGRTGQEVWDNLATDKRFLPFLEERRFPAGKLKAIVKPGSPLPEQVYHFEPAGEWLPFFDRHTLGLNFSSHHLEILDRRNSEVVRGSQLPRTMFQTIVQNQVLANAARFTYRTLGHLVVLPVGDMVFGIDPVHRRLLWEHNLAGPSVPANVGQPQTMPAIVADPRDGSVQLIYLDGWSQRVGQPLVMGPSALCLWTRDGLQGIDPLTGKTVWKRTDVVANGGIFGDDEVACVVHLGTDDKPNSTRLFRLADGASVKAPDFAALYDKRLRTLGRRLLLSESDKEGVTLRLYDVVAGKDTWAKTFAPSSVVLRSEDPRLAGVVQPDGKVRVIDLATRKDVLDTDKGYGVKNPRTGMDPDHLANLQGITLLSDRKQIYLATNGQTDSNLVRFGRVESNLYPGLGLRCRPINGRLYAYDRQSGAFRWQTAIFNQMLVLDHFQELPIILFTSRYQKWQNPAVGQVREVVAVMSLDKRTGKFLFDSKELTNTANFHTLRVDARAGRIEFASFTMTLVHQAAADPAPAP